MGKYKIGDVVTARPDSTVVIRAAKKTERGWEVLKSRYRFEVGDIVMNTTIENDAYSLDQNYIIDRLLEKYK